MSTVRPQTSESDPRYVALLGLAEQFRTAKPANIRLAIHCLKAVFVAQPPPRVAARTHLQIGKLLLQYGVDPADAKEHLEKCGGICGGARLPYDDLRFEAADLFAVAVRRTSTPEEAIASLADAVEQSQKAPYWHCRWSVYACLRHDVRNDGPTDGRTYSCRDARMQPKRSGKPSEIHAVL